MPSLIARKPSQFLKARPSIASKKLPPIKAIRILGEERKFGQYKVARNGKTRYFKNFYDLRAYIETVLFGNYNHIIIEKDQATCGGGC